MFFTPTKSTYSHFTVKKYSERSLSFFKFWYHIRLLVMTFYHQHLFSTQWWIAVCKISLEGQTCCTVLYYDNVSNLTFHANEAWMESNSFQSPGWTATVISQVSRAGWGHAQAIKKVTAHPAQWQAEASQTHTYAYIHRSLSVCTQPTSM